MKIYENDGQITNITFEDFLAKYGKTVDDIVKIYHGLDDHCRCGCGGNYFYSNKQEDKVGFTRAINALKKEDFVTNNVEFDSRSAYWLNIPKPYADNRCYCIYFKIPQFVEI